MVPETKTQLLALTATGTPCQRLHLTGNSWLPISDLRSRCRVIGPLRQQKHILRYWKNNTTGDNYATTFTVWSTVSVNFYVTNATIQATFTCRLLTRSFCTFKTKIQNVRNTSSETKKRFKCTTTVRLNICTENISTWQWQILYSNKNCNTTHW